MGQSKSQAKPDSRGKEIRLPLLVRSRKVPLERVWVGRGGVANCGLSCKQSTMTVPGGASGTPYMHTKFRQPRGSLHAAGLEPRGRSHLRVSIQMSPAALLHLCTVTRPREQHGQEHGPATRGVSSGKERHRPRKKGRECRAPQNAQTAAAESPSPPAKKQKPP